MYSHLAGKTHIHLCTPCYGCKMRKEFLGSVLNFLALATRYGVHVSIDFIGNESLITRGRNILAAKFLKGTATHLLFVDADIAFDPSVIFRMVAFDRDVVTAAYPSKAIGWESVRAKLQDESTEPIQAMGLDYNVNIIDPRSDVSDGFIRVLDSATGFMLIKRSALERMRAHYKETLECVNDITSTRADIPTYVALFDTMIDPKTRRYLSEDYAFCRRAQALGIEVWVDIMSPLVHIGSQELHGDISQRFRMTYDD